MINLDLLLNFPNSLNLDEYIKFPSLSNENIDLFFLQTVKIFFVKFAFIDIK